MIEVHAHGPFVLGACSFASRIYVVMPHFNTWDSVSIKPRAIVGEPQVSSHPPPRSGMARLVVVAVLLAAARLGAAEPMMRGAAALGKGQGSACGVQCRISGQTNANTCFDRVTYLANHDALPLAEALEQVDRECAGQCTCGPQDFVTQLNRSESEQARTAAAPNTTNLTESERDRMVVPPSSLPIAKLARANSTYDCPCFGQDNTCYACTGSDGSCYWYDCGNYCSNTQC